MDDKVEYLTRSSDFSWMALVGGAALGALAMYMTDPSQGRRRRALLQDKVMSATHKTSQLMNRTLRDTRNRLTGLQAEAMRMMSPHAAKPLDDHVLEARVRSRLGRALPHLSHVEVIAHEGTVRLAGNISDEDEDRLLEAVEAIPGVEAVEHHLQAHTARRGTNWRGGRSPLWVAGAVGAGLLTWYGLSQRQPLGLVAAATSLGLMARASIPSRAHAGSSLARSVDEAVSRFDSEGFEGERTIEIAATPEMVFDVWSRYENFPHFMSPVIEVRDLGNQRSRWVAQGPGGKEVEWDCVLAESTRPHRLAWRSESGALVDHTGSVQFEPVANGSRATLRVSWRPPADAVGKGMAVRMGADPEAALEEDLRRMKQFIERTLSSRDGRREGEVRVTGRSTILH